MEDPSVPDSVKTCVAMLKAADNDTKKFAALFMVTKLVKSKDCIPKAKELLLDAIGVDFLRRLLLSPSSDDCPSQIYKSVALAILSSFCSDPQVAKKPEILSQIPTFFEIVQQVDADDCDDNLTILNEAYECLRCIAMHDEGKDALIKEGAVQKMVDMYCQQSFQADEALQILVILVQHGGNSVWDQQNSTNFNSLLNKLSVDFEIDHSERKFEICTALQHIVSSCQRQTVINTSSEESWPLSIYKGLNDILVSKISKNQRDPALKLASVMIDALGVEWTLLDGEKPKQFLLLLVHLSSVEVRMQLEDRNFDQIFKNIELVISCFIILELAVSYIANDVLDLETKEKQQLYTALKGAFSAVLGTIKKMMTKTRDMGKTLDEREKMFTFAMVRVLASWLAQETTAMRSTVHEVLPFVLSITNESFYNYRSWFISEKTKFPLSNEVVLDHKHVDILRLMLPALCHFTVEDKGRDIMLSVKEDEVLLDSFNFHWSIVDYKKPLIPKSERLKQKKPAQELPQSLQDAMKDSRTAMVSMCNIFMNFIVLDPKLAETGKTFSALLKFVFNNLTELKNTPENLVLHANLAILGLLLLRHQSKHLNKNDFSICRYIQSTIRFLWDAFNVDESNDASSLVVSMTYKKYWIELMELWFLGMQTMSIVLSQIPWISEFIMETGWAPGIIDTLKKVKVGSLPANTKAAYEDFLCHLVKTNKEVIPVFKEHDALTVCRKHMFMELGKLLFGD